MLSLTTIGFMRSTHGTMSQRQKCNPGSRKCFPFLLKDMTKCKTEESILYTQKTSQNHFLLIAAFLKVPHMISNQLMNTPSWPLPNTLNTQSGQTILLALFTFNSIIQFNTTSQFLQLSSTFFSYEKTWEFAKGVQNLSVYQLRKEMVKTHTLISLFYNTLLHFVPQNSIVSNKLKSQHFNRGGSLHGR